MQNQNDNHRSSPSSSSWMTQSTIHKRNVDRQHRIQQRRQQLQRLKQPQLVVQRNVPVSDPTTLFFADDTTSFFTDDETRISYHNTSPVSSSSFGSVQSHHRNHLFSWTQSIILGTGIVIGRAMFSVLKVSTKYTYHKLPSDFIYPVYTLGLATKNGMNNRFVPFYARNHHSSTKWTTTLRKWYHNHRHAKPVMMILALLGGYEATSKIILGSHRI